MGFISSVASSVRKRLLDTFSTRSDTTGSLGTASDGSDWTATSQTIEVKSGAAKATTTPVSASGGTAYPIATVSMPTQDNVISIADTNEGSSAALWVQSSSDWWIVDIEAVQNAVTNYASGSNFYYTFGLVQGFASAPQTYAGYTTSTVYWARYALASGKYNTFYSAGTNYTVKYTTQNFSNTIYWYGTIGQTTYYTYASGATYTYSEYLKIRQSVSSVVSVITSALISSAQTIKSLKVFTSGNQITAKAYSDNNFVTQLGSDLVYTASGATINTQYGISVSPSDYNQSAIIGTSVDISRN